MSAKKNKIKEFILSNEDFGEFKNISLRD